ncbi:MAG: RHS repeat-associated core domain-containing protein, partial [Ilumatobacteraceae bacterium]
MLKGDGSREVFQWDGVSAYLTPGGYTSKLVKTGTTGWALTEANGYVTTFRSDGRLASIADADNQKLNLTWNASNQVTMVADQVSGRALTFTYSAGRVASVSTSAVTGPGYSGPLTWNYVYYGSDLSKVCEPRNNNPVTGSCIGYTVVGGRITEIVDRNGHVDRKVGYVDGKLAWTEDGLANRTIYSYPTPYKTIVTDPKQHATTTEFDSQFRLVKVTDAAGGVTTFEYSSAGYRNKTTDQLGHVTSQVFDVRGNVVSETDALGFTRYMAYDAYNNLTQNRDARSASATDNTYLITTTWDGVARNKLSESTPPTPQQPSGTVQTWVYTTGSEPAIGGGLTPKGLLKSSSDALGGVDTYGYDSLGNLRDSLDKSGLHTTYGYDSLGRVISQTAFPTAFPSGVVTTYEYDQLGNLIGQNDPATTNAVTSEVHQHRTTAVYDGASNLVQNTESDIGGSAHSDASRVVQYTYDAADHPISSTDPEGGVTIREYDAIGNLTASIDPRGIRHETAFDERNLPVATTVKAAVVDPGSSSARDVVVAVAGYDASGRQITATDARGVTITLRYDAVGQVTSKTLNNYHDRNGSARNVVLQATTYDRAGHPLTQTTGNGLRVEQYAFDAAGRMVSATLDPAGLNRTTASVYDAAGNVVRKTLSDGSRTEEARMAYDAGGQLISSTVENGASDLTTTYTRDNREAVVSMVEPRGNVAGASPATYRVDYQLDALARVATTTSPPVSVTENGVTTPAGRPATVVGLDTYGQVTQYRDERGFITTQTFDRLGRVTMITHPAAPVSGGGTVAPTEHFAFDAVGNLVARTDRRGETTTFTYDGLNRAVTQTDPAVGVSPAGVVATAYDDSGNATLTIDQLGAQTEATFDDAGRQRTVTSVVRNGTATPDRYTTTFDYDDLGNRVFEQAPTGEVTRWEYSIASELAKQIDPLLAESVTTHDVAGRVVSTTDPLGRVITFEYDLAGRQVAQRSFAPDSTLLSTSSTTYDAAGNVIASTTPRGVVSGNTAAYTTSYHYDAISRLTTVAQPTSPAHVLETGYRYDASGNQTALIDARGYTTAYTFNPWGLQASLIEPATTAYPNAADRTWTTAYDSAGLPVRTIEPGGVTVDRAFDELGRLVSETGAGAGAAAATRTFGYDAAGRQVSAGSPAGDIGFVFDDRALLTSTTGPSQYSSSFSYDASGRMLSRTDAAGVTTFDWTPRNQLATAADPLTGSSRSNTFDAAGQLTGVAYSGGGSRALLYDDLGRLTSDVMKASTGTVTAGYSYGYDADGNVTGVDVNLPGNPSAGSNQYGYDNAGRLTSWTKPDTTTVTFGYDDVGNLVNNAGVMAVFDARNQLQSTGAATYQWSARGTLLSVTEGGMTTPSTFDGLNRNTSTGTASFTYDSLDRVANTGSTVFAYAGREIDPVAVGAMRFARSPAGLPIAAQSGTDPAVLLGRNGHGDIGYQYAANGVVSATRAYDPLGDVIGETGTLTPLGYQGDYTDPTTGDVWMGARWYRPGTGTFINRDTVFGHLQTPISLNRYTYAYGDPLGMFDPDGREPACGPTATSGTSCRQAHEDAAANQPVYAFEQVDGCTSCDLSDALHSTDVEVRSLSRARYDKLGEYDRWEIAKQQRDICSGGGLNVNNRATRLLYG